LDHITISRLKRQHILLVAVLAIVGIIVFLMVTLNYHSLIFTWWNEQASKGIVDRGIGTNGELIVNGYLGIFLRFKHFGFINLFAVPLIVYILLSYKKRTRLEIALCFAIVLACLFICIFGYYNTRYQLTLHPILVFGVIIIGIDLIKRIKPISKKTYQYIFIGVCISIFIVFYLIYPYPVIEKFKYYREKYGIENMYNRMYPVSIIEYINNEMELNKDDVILEFNQPFLYYHTNKKGLSRSNPIIKDFYRNSANKKKAFNILWDKLHVRYILIRGELSKHYKPYAIDVVYSENGLNLFKIRPPDLR